MPTEDEAAILRSEFIPLPKTSTIKGFVATSTAFATYDIFWKVSLLIWCFIPTAKLLFADVRIQTSDHRGETCPLPTSNNGLTCAQYPASYTIRLEQFILHKGSKVTIDELIVAAGAFQEELHNEIWVYDNSYWEKDAALWTEVQKADWKDVILEAEFKAQLIDQVMGFYSQEKIYKVGRAIVNDLVNSI